MYPAKDIQTPEQERDKLNAVINDNPLATLLVNTSRALPHISHIPFHFAEGDDTSGAKDQVLIAHVGNRHPLAEKLLANKHVPVSIVFHGDQSYISPHCFDNVKENSGGQVVPTWNYVKVHVSGFATPILTTEDKYQQMTLSSQYFERAQVKPWKITELSDKKVTQMLSAISFFKVTINSIEGNFKLSQLKPEQLRNASLNSYSK